MFASLKDLELYYEIHGAGKPLVLIHGGGSTIQSTFGRILPYLSASFQVIAVEMQAHGRTQDNGRPLTFEQDADNVAALLSHLGIGKASFLGFSNGATTTLQIGIRHKQLVDKLVIVAALIQRSGMPPGFFDGFNNATLDHMPARLQSAFLDVNPDRQALQTMFERDVERMKAFKDIDEALIKSIEAPTLVLQNDNDVIQNEHAVKLFRLLPESRLAIFPGIHGECIGEVTTPVTKGQLNYTVELITEWVND